MRHLEQRLSPNTINRRRAAAKASCRCGLALGILRTDPSAKLKQVRREQPAPKSLTRNQKNALLRVVERSGRKRNTAIVDLMVF